MLHANESRDPLHLDMIAIGAEGDEGPLEAEAQWTGGYSESGSARARPVAPPWPQ